MKIPLIDKIFKTSNQGQNFIGAPSFRHVNPGYFGHYKSNQYASAYPSIRAIANEYMVVQPFAINANGKQTPHAAINALYHPNQLDSSVSFAEKMAVSTLVKKNTYILVWRNDGGEAKPGGNFGYRGNNIAGYTFLENPGITRRDNRTYYNIGAQYFTEDEVLVLPGGVDPEALYAGYSPTESATRWLTVDDYVADFQGGFFENNAIPAGQFIITAASVTEYNDTVDMLQSKHRGAGKNNNVTYAHRPIDPTTNKAAEAQIQWVPFAQSNKDIDFKNLFEQTNKRIDLAYGVPQIIKGVDDAATYANAQVAEKTFAKRAVLPLLTRNYTQFTHELNRITGGLGVAITFKYDIPTVADEMKVEAETKVLESQIIRTMVLEGYTLNSVVDSFKLSNSYKNLKVGDDKSTVIDNDKPDVDEGDEVESAPDPTKIDGTTPVNEAAKRTNPKAQLSDTDSEAYEIQLAGVIRADMQKQVDAAVDAVDSTQDATEDEEAEELTDEMMVHIVTIMVAAGTLQYTDGLMMLIAAGVNTDGATAFSLSEAQEDAYRKYLKSVAKSYRDDTAASIRAVLDRADAEGWNRAQLQTQLRNIMNTDEWRVTRLARSELNRSQQVGELESMIQLQDEVDVKMTKTWNTSSTTPCPTCAALDGTTKPIDEPFLNEGSSIELDDGGTFVNTFVSMTVAQAHPNDNCYITYNVEDDD